MRYQRLNDETSIIVGENGETQLFSSSFNQNQTIRHLRKIVLLILFIQFILSTILLIIINRLLINKQDDNHKQGMRSLPPTILSLVYYAYGLIVFYRYHHFGIYVFSWLGFLQYISLCAEVFFNIITIVKHSSHYSHAKFGINISVIITIISALQTILIVITLKLSFKTNRFMKIFKREVLEQL